MQRCLSLLQKQPDTGIAFQADGEIVGVAGFTVIADSCKQVGSGGPEGLIAAQARV